LFLSCANYPSEADTMVKFDEQNNIFIEKNNKRYYVAFQKVKNEEA